MTDVKLHQLVSDGTVYSAYVVPLDADNLLVAIEPSPDGQRRWLTLRSDGQIIDAGYVAEKVGGKPDHVDVVNLTRLIAQALGRRPHFLGEG